MAEKSHGPRWLGTAIDGGPGLAFLAVLLVTRDFRLATIVLIAGAVVALAVMLAVERRFRALPTAVSVLAIAFGGGSLLLHDPQLLKMKTSLVDGALGAVLLGGVAIRRNPLKMVLGATLNLPDKAWATLAVRCLATGRIGVSVPLIGVGSDLKLRRLSTMPEWFSMAVDSQPEMAAKSSASLIRAFSM